MTVAIVDYGMGNRRSVEKAFEHVGARAVVTRDHELIAAAERIVIPGVGAFPAAMERLDALGLTELLRERARAGVPTLGICLGMQLLFESSPEHGGRRDRMRRRDSASRRTIFRTHPNRRMTRAGSSKKIESC